MTHACTLSPALLLACPPALLAEEDEHTRWLADYCKALCRLVRGMDPTAIKLKLLATEASNNLDFVNPAT